METTGGAELRQAQDAKAVFIDGKPTSKEHFGYTDGFGNPDFEGVERHSQPGQGKLTKDGQWVPLATGEFILGYPDEAGELPVAPVPHLLANNGTFMVYRKLQMHVATFRSFIAEKARHYPGGEEMLAAKIVGRWRDGTPLSVSPERPDADVAGNPERVNDFSYANDPTGLRCPVGAHIRRAHPRDSEGFFDGKLTNRHRIVRRGRSYGPALAEGALVDDGVERGLAFVCFNASIWRQFETIQRLWIDDGDPFRLGTDKDFLTGCPVDGTGKMTIPGKPPFFLAPQPRFVTLRGGEYLFQPSISALRWIAAL